MAGSSRRGAGVDATGQTRTSGTVPAVPTIVVLVALGIALRLIIAYVLLPGAGFQTDLQSFQAWGQQIAANGPLGFYEDPHAFHDYPPVYLYILGLVGVLTSPEGGIGVAVKIVPMLCDLAMAVIVWKMAEELGAARWRALAAALVVAVIPIVWFNSAIWGQADSVGTVILLLGLRELIKDRRETAAALAVAAALTKPQLGILAILVGIVILRRSLWPKNPEEFAPRRVVTSMLAGVATAAVICVPFVGFRFDSLQAEAGRLFSSGSLLPGDYLSSPAGLLQLVAALLVAIGVFYIVVTSTSPWIRGEDEERRRGFDPIVTLSAAGFAISAGVLFAGVRFDVIIHQMVTTFGEYSDLTVNAYNPWALLVADGPRGPEGMATTLSWVADLPDLIGHHATDAAIFWFGPYPSNVALFAGIAVVGGLVAAVLRIAGRPRTGLGVAVAALAVAAVAGALATIPGGPVPATIAVPAALVGEVSLLTVLAVTAVWAAWRDDDLSLTVALAILAIAFFVVPTRAHERYLFPFFGIGAVLAAISPRWRRLYLVLSVANLLNLLSVLGQYHGILTNSMAATPERYPLESLLNDWSGWVRNWRVDSADPTSVIIPVAVVSIVMGLGFLWAIAQLAPRAVIELEAERELAGLEFIPPDDEDDGEDELETRLEAEPQTNG